MFLSDLSIKRPILISMVLVVFVIFGGLAYFNLSLDLAPRTNVGVVTIQTVYPGAGPEEVETQVTERIEDSVSAISEIDNMNSYSMDSVSIVVVMFEETKDVNTAIREVKDKIDTIANLLPDDAQVPTVDKIDPNAEPVMELMLTGNRGLVELTEIAENQLKDKFSRIPDVASVSILGGREREIRVEFDNRLVFEQNISIPQLSQYIASQNLNLPAGQFRNRGQNYTVRYQGLISDVRTLRELEVPAGAGMKQLRDIAKVKDAGADIRERAVFFNKLKEERNENIVLLSIIKSSDGNSVKIANALNKALPEIEKELPQGLSLSVIDDRSEFVKGSVTDTLSTIMLGIMLTALVLLFFLHDIRSVIIASLSMPFSIISTFLLMQVSGFSLNLLSLMGISTAVGVLVTNSVVVLENIFRHKQSGDSAVKAAGKGTAEVALAVIASTLTNIMVFLPIATMEGIIGQFFVQFGLTVTFATLFSLLVSFTLTPMMASLILKDTNGKKHPIGEKIESLFTRLENGYQKILRSILRNKKRSFATLAAALGLLFLSLIPAGGIGFAFMPQLDNGEVAVEMELQQGTSLARTLKKAEQAETVLRSFPEVRHIVTEAGKLSDMDVGLNLVKLSVKLVDSEQREKSTTDMVPEFNKALSGIPGARIDVKIASRMAEGMAAVQFYLRGDSNRKLEEIGNQLTGQLKEVPGLVNLKSSLSPGNPEIAVIPDNRKLTETGISGMEVALAVRSAVDGLTATQFKEGGEEYDIRLTLADSSINTPEEIGSLPVLSRAARTSYRIDQLAEVRLDKSPSRILHRDKLKAVEFRGEVSRGYALGDLVNTIKSEIDKTALPAGYSVVWAGQAEMMHKSVREMGFAFFLSIVLTYMLLAAILESLSQPLMILSTVPLAMIGVFFAMPIFNMNMDIMAMMAVIMLIGIVVNNGILILDHANMLRKKGTAVSEALAEAGRVKLKPILMTTIAIILGMMPMALGFGDFAAEARQPMGLVSISGLFVSGFLTLFVLPAMVNLFTRNKNVKETEQ